MLRLLLCEIKKLKRKPLFLAASAASVLLPLGYALFLSDAKNSVDAVEGMMSSLFQLSAYMLLMPVLVVLACNLLFEEQDNDTMKNLLCVPVSKVWLSVAKLLLLLIFAVLFMAVGGLLSLVVLLLQGWKPIGFWRLFFVGLGEGVIMWAGALPCILVVTALNKSYIISVILAFFYTVLNYLLASNNAFLTQPLGLNPGTLLPGPLAFRWFFQYFDFSNAGEEMLGLLERIRPYFLDTVSVFAVAAGEAALFLFLIAVVYKRQKH